MTKVERLHAGHISISILYDIYCLMLLKAVSENAMPGSPLIASFEWPQLLTLSRPVLASASLDFLFRCHEDVLPCFTWMHKPWLLRDVGLRRTGT